ncbi:MAG TPA: TatD family hydrolase [Chthoniobacteraceae bacterium]|nr:TatD family hydrolase [Chthoniobacteraceae bacterium]
MLTETHAHLDFPELSRDVPGVLARAAEAGVTRVISIGTSLEGSRRAVALAEQYPGVWATVGIHPTNVDAQSDSQLDDLRELAKNPRVVAIGEIGLDYHWLPSETARREGKLTPENTAALLAEDEANRRDQTRLFHLQMELASELGLNVVIHQRAAWDDTLAALRSTKARCSAVFHCFTETFARAEEVFALGHLVSFTGIITFKNAAVAQETVRRVPAGSFMVETDSPYLAPAPHRGKPCQPAYTRLVAEEVARLRGRPLAEIAAETEATAERFFWRNRGAAS